MLSSNIFLSIASLEFIFLTTVEIVVVYNRAKLDRILNDGIRDITT